MDTAQLINNKPDIKNFVVSSINEYFPDDVGIYLQKKHKLISKGKKGSMKISETELKRIDKIL